MRAAVAGVGSPFGDRGAIDILSSAPLRTAEFPRKQSFETAILAGSEIRNVPERRPHAVDRRTHYSPIGAAAPLVRIAI
jgi:hypothetical protein